MDTYDADQLTDTQVEWLHDVATYRTTCHITSCDPLGAIPDDAEYLATFDSLLDDLAASRHAEQPAHHLSIEL